MVIIYLEQYATRIMFFSVLNDQEVQGEWRLIVEALANNNASQLNSWTLSLCANCINNYSTANGNPLKGSFPMDYSYNNR